MLIFVAPSFFIYWISRCFCASSFFVLDEALVLMLAVLFLALAFFVYTNSSPDLFALVLFPHSSSALCLYVSSLYILPNVAHWLDICVHPDRLANDMHQYVVSSFPGNILQFLFAIFIYFFIWALGYYVALLRALLYLSIFISKYFFTLYCCGVCNI